MENNYSVFGTFDNDLSVGQSMWRGDNEAIRGDLLLQLDNNYKKGITKGEYTEDEYRNLEIRVITGDEFDLSEFNKLNNIKMAYEFENEQRIIDYLHDNQILLDVLLKAIEKIKSIFGQKRVIKLRVTENDDSYSEMLNLVIMCDDLDVPDALNLLDKLDNVWWLEKQKSVAFLMIIDVGF